MAFSSRSCLFFLTLVLFATQIKARDSYFFGKFHRETLKDQNPNTRIYEKTNETTEQDDQNPTFIPESRNGYGLYGHETTYNNNEELNNKNYDDSFSTPSLSQTKESYKNDGENYYPKTIESYDNNMDTMSYYENSNEGYSNNVERQGMSDTRFMANGNYYFDLDDERNHGRFYQKHHDNYNPNGYNAKSSFENPNNMMSQPSEMFGEEEQRDQFTP